MCRTEEAPATTAITHAISRRARSCDSAAIRRANVYEHPKRQLSSGGLRTPAGGNDNKNMNIQRRGRVQNPSGEHPRAIRGTLKPCRYGNACRGINSYCKFSHADNAVNDEWSVVSRKRRRSVHPEGRGS
jgi:hypothetical protein